MNNSKRIIVPNLEFGADGQYRVIVTDMRYNKVKTDTGWFSNLLLNRGLDIMLQGGFLRSGSQCHVGTGTSEPNASETQLVNQLAKQSRRERSHTNYTYSSYSNTEPYWHGATAYYYFDPGEVIGNISEVGISNDGGNGNLCSRALILDNASQPTTISVTQYDSLTVVYTGRIFTPTNEVTGTIDFGGELLEYKIRAAGAGVNASHIGAGLFEYGLNGYTTGSRYVYVSNQAIRAYTEDAHRTAGKYDFSVGTYVPGTFTRNCSMIWGQFDVVQVWKTLVFQAGGSAYAGSSWFQAELTPAFNKTNKKAVALNWKVGIARYTG